MERRRGALAFLGDRIVRLGLTLALFGLIIDAINPPIDFELGHLWFLYHLLMICGLASAAFALTRAFPGVLEPVARAVAWPARHVAGLLLYLPLLLLLTIYARPPVRTVIPHYLNEIEPLALAYNTLWFIIGAALYHHRDTIATLANGWLLALSGVVAVASMMMFWGLAHQTYTDHRALLLWLPSSTLATFSWTLFMVGLATRMLNRRNRVVNWFVRVSYPVYVFHLQPSIWIGVIGLSAGMTAGTLMLPTIAISFGSSRLLYYHFVCFTPLEWLFNGHRRAWFRPHWIGLGRKPARRHARTDSASPGKSGSSRVIEGVQMLTEAQRHPRLPQRFPWAGPRDHGANPLDIDVVKAVSAKLLEYGDFPDQPVLPGVSPALRLMCSG